MDPGTRAVSRSVRRRPSESGRRGTRREGLVAAVIRMRGPGENSRNGCRPSPVLPRVVSRFSETNRGSDYSRPAVNHRQSRRNHGRIALVIRTSPALDLTDDGTEGEEGTENDGAIRNIRAGRSECRTVSPPRKSAMSTATTTKAFIVHASPGVEPDCTPLTSRAKYPIRVRPTPLHSPVGPRFDIAEVLDSPAFRTTCSNGKPRSPGWTPTRVSE